MKNATIVFKQGYSTMRCKILDLSGTGARLAPAHAPLCPSEFVLKCDVGPPRNCEVMWRKDTDLGVRFIPASDAILSAADTTAVPTETAVIRTFDSTPGNPTTGQFGLRAAFDQSIIANQGDIRRGALLVISISNLGLVKAAYGEDVAKTVFSSVERKLQQVVRGLDVMGRLGDIKFGIVLSHCPPEHVPAVAKRFLAAVQSQPIVTRDAVIEVVLSTSITVPHGGLTLSDLIDQADPPVMCPPQVTERAGKEPIPLGAGHAKLTGVLISSNLDAAN